MQEQRPIDGTYAPYYKRYIDQVPDGDIISTLEDQFSTFADFTAQLTGPELDFRYEPGKWSTRQVLMHVLDCERIFTYRALAFSRGETQSLPGFDQDAYVEETECGHRTSADLAEEFESIRKSTLTFFKSLTLDQWNASGIANAVPMTVHATAWIIAGHLVHHWRILKERYGIKH